MPNRALDLDDLATPIVTSTPRACGIRPRRCLTPRRGKYCRFLDDPYYHYPCTRAPRCASSSPYRRRVQDCHTFSKRGLKSGRVVCDNFSSVCYPRNMANYCGYRNPRRPYSCSPNRCYRPCTSPVVCENGICRGVCKCRPAPSCRTRSPCSPMGDTLCERDTSTNFVDAVNEMGPLTSRYEPHMCPWEADVTVSGTIKAHCTSTADEISERLAGPFKALGRRYTTDAESNWDSRDSRAQKLSLGQLDDGGVLDFSKNNRSTMPDNLDYRVRRITNSPTESRKSRPSYHKSSKGGHIHWDKHINDDDDFYETERRYPYSPRKRHDKYHGEDDKRYSSFKEFGPRSQTYGGFEMMENRRATATNNNKLESNFKEGRYPVTSDTEREESTHTHRPKGVNRDWQRWHDAVTDDDDAEDDDERDRYYARDRYKPSIKYSVSEARGSNGSYRDYQRYSSAGGDRENGSDRRYKDIHEDDTRWARRYSDRKPDRYSDRNPEGKRGGIRFWPR